MKTIKEQIKTILLLLVLALSTNSYAQNEIKKSGMFVRIYNLDGKKFNKGYVVSVGDTVLGLKRKGKYTEINVREMGSIKTKRSGGHNVLIGAVAGATTGVILGISTADPDSFLGYSASEGASGFGLAGALGGAAIGGISIAFKNSETFVINGDLESWSLFQKRMQK